MAFTGTLLPYQQDAFDRMVARRRVLVAYDLGLGKTVITIAAIEELRERGDIARPTLVVCLSSLKYQWAKEIRKFSDSSATVIDGTKQQRQQQYAGSVAHATDYVIVNYEQVVNDWESLSGMHFDAIVCDEATAIKSFRSKRSQRVKQLSDRVDVRFGLTGTPIENGRPEELYSIMQAIDPQVLGTRFAIFDAAFIVRNFFGGVERYQNLDALHARMRPALVRKSQTDPDVAPYLPVTIERDPVLVPFDRHGASMYRIISGSLEEELASAQLTFGDAWNVTQHYGTSGPLATAADATRGSIMSKITALRMLCDHPDVLTLSAEKHDASSSGDGSKFAYDLLADAKVQEMLGKAKGPKLDALTEMVSDHLLDDANKVVVFCSYVHMASMIRDAVGGVMYTGQMSALEKESAKEQFQTDPNTRVLVSTDAGGYGVDLPQANMLINYDLPWSSGLAAQRNGRIRRASSKWPSIVVQDILMADSLEERQYEVLRQKGRVASAVIDGEGINDLGGVDLTAGSLTAFLQAVSV